MDELLYRLLIIRLLGGTPASGGADMGELVQQRVARDPQFALMAKMLGVTPALPSGGDAAQAPSTGEVQVSPTPVTETVNTELEALRARNEALAAAVGACPECWGEDSVCAECGGNGVPGSKTPHAEMFQRFVAPAVLIEAEAEAPARNTIAKEDSDGDLVPRDGSRRGSRRSIRRGG